MKLNSDRTYGMSQYIKNLVLTLLDKAFKICSNYDLVHKEF